MDPTTEEVIDAVDFDFGAKKKKKKKKAEEEEIAPAAAEVPAAAADEATEPASSDAAVPDFDEAGLDDFSFGDKKKKKKKKAVDVDLTSVQAEGPKDAKPADELEAIISLELRKKKRQKKDYAAFVAELGEDADGSDEEADVPDYEGEGDEDVGYETDPMAPFQGNENDYTYNDLLSRAFYKIRQAHPEMGDRKRYTMIPPQILREGTKKTIFSNLTEICKRMHRNQDHVVQFLFTELGTSGSIDGNNRLVIKGRYMPKHIENVLRHYIIEYVTCKICKSPNTVLVKENRLNFVHCENCNSTRSVAAIKSGFSAQIGRRKH